MREGFVGDPRLTATFSQMAQDSVNEDPDLVTAALQFSHLRKG